MQSSGFWQSRHWEDIGSLAFDVLLDFFFFSDYENLSVKARAQLCTSYSFKKKNQVASLNYCYGSSGV